jgi:hypothetical protein
MWMKREPHGRGIWYLVYTDDIAECLSPPPTLNPTPNKFAALGYRYKYYWSIGQLLNLTNA